MIELGIARLPRPKPIETRAEEPSWAALRGGVDLGSAFINPAAAENLSTVLACVSAISRGVASLPAFVYANEGNSQRIDENHPVSRLIRFGPSEHQSWSDWLEFTLAQVLLRGNSISEIVSDGRGAVTGLRPIPWEHTNVQLLPNGRLIFDVTEMTSVGGTGRMRRLLQDQVFFLRDRSDDGLIGRSRLQRAASVLQAGLYIQTFATELYRTGINPSGAIELDDPIDKEQGDALRAKVTALYGGTRGVGRVLVLHSGAKWKQISISPEDAEFLNSRKFTTEELCRLFDVPPVIVGDLSNSSFNNTETLTRFYAQNTLAPWIKKIELEFSRSILGAGRRLEIDLSGLLRGAPTERWQAWKIAIETGVLTPQQVALEEGFSPAS